MNTEHKRARAEISDTGGSPELPASISTAAELQALTNQGREEINQVQPQGVAFHRGPYQLNCCPSCERLSPFDVNERGHQYDAKCVHCHWSASGWWFDITSAAMLTRRTKESPFE